MTQLDMTEAITESEFQDYFVVVRRATSTDNFGRVQITTSSQRTNGIVTIGGDQSVNRGEDSQSTNKTINIITRYPLRQVTKGYQPDIIQWHGESYMVMDVSDFSTYGLGWYKVTAELRDFVGLAQPWQNNLPQQP